MTSKLTIILIVVHLTVACSDNDNYAGVAIGGTKATGGTGTGTATATGGAPSQSGSGGVPSTFADTRVTGGVQSTLADTTAIGGTVPTTGGAPSQGGAGGVPSTLADTSANGGITTSASSGLGGAQPESGGTSNAGQSSSGGTAPAGDINAVGGTAPMGGVSAAGGGTTGATAQSGGSPPTGGTLSCPALTGGAATNGGTGGVGTTDGGTGTTGDAGTSCDAGTDDTNASGDAGGSTGEGTTTSTTAPAPTCVTSGPAPAQYWQATPVTTVTSGIADITVDVSSAAQTWEGFGGAFNEMGRSDLATTALQSEAIDLLFGTQGAHFTMGRIPVGSSDYAMSRYTLDDTADPNDPVPNSDQSNRPPADTALSKFSLDRDTQLLIPYIQAALAVNPNLRLWASPWTPPVWMKAGYKTNAAVPVGGAAARPSYFDGGNMKSDTTTVNALAQYFVKFIKAYKDKGINIDTIAPQNEPTYDQNFPSCVWDAATYTNFVKVLGPALSGASVTTKIMLGTMSDPTSDATIVTAVMGDATAKALISTIGVQWGMTDNIASYVSSYGLPIWVSEHKCGNYPWLSSTYVAQAPNDQAYAVESWGYLRNAIKAGVTAYNAWNMVLDPVGKNIDVSRPWAQNALLLVDHGSIVRTPTYYVFRHLSQYVQPQAKLVAVSGSGASDAVAFKNIDGSIVVTMHNSACAKTSIVQVAGTKLQFNIPTNGWATVVAH